MVLAPLLKDSFPTAATAAAAAASNEKWPWQLLTKFAGVKCLLDA